MRHYRSIDQRCLQFTREILEQHRIRGEMHTRILLLLDSDKAEDTRAHPKRVSTKDDRHNHWPTNQSRDPLQRRRESAKSRYIANTVQHRVQTSQTAKIAGSSSSTLFRTVKSQDG